MSLSRRRFLKATAALSAMAVGGLPAGWVRAAEKKGIPIGLQLYSVRDDAAGDLPRVLEAVAKMGYKGVEFAGYYGFAAEEIRRLLDVNGLVCCGTHIGIDTLQGDAIKATIDFNQTLGNPFLIVSWLPEPMRNSLEAIEKTADLFNKIAAQLKPHGMATGYHAHGGDFAKIGEKTQWDLLFEKTVDDVVMQMDTGNCLEGGGDPIATLKRFPGRAKTVHLKEHGGAKGAPIGEGAVDWDAVFSVCETTAGTEWYVVEHEQYAEGMTPLASVEACLKNVIRLQRERLARRADA